jgi:hypothetical protein
MEPEEKDIADLIEDVRTAIEQGYPQSRERSLALTKLDECALWLVATGIELGAVDARE